MKKRAARTKRSTAKGAFKYGDLAHLASQMSLSLEDLSLPQEVLDDFDQAIDKLERTLMDAQESNEHSEG